MVPYDNIRVFKHTWSANSFGLIGKSKNVKCQFRFSLVSEYKIKNVV